MPQNELNLLTDTIILLREKASEAKNAGLKGDAFEKGRQFAYYEVLSLIQQQLVAFGISEEKVGMLNFDPEKEIL